MCRGGVYRLRQRGADSTDLVLRVAAQIQELPRQISPLRTVRHFPAQESRLFQVRTTSLIRKTYDLLSIVPVISSSRNNDASSLEEEGEDGVEVVGSIDGPHEALG